MLRFSVVLLAVPALLVLGGTPDRNLFKTDGEVQKEEVFAPWQMKTAGANKKLKNLELGAAALLAHMDPKWIPENLFYDKNKMYSDQVPIDIYVNYGTDDGKGVKKTTKVKDAFDKLKGRPSVWQYPLFQAYGETRNYYNLFKNKSATVADCLHHFTTLNPTVTKIAVQANPEKDQDKDKRDKNIWDFLDKVKSHPASIIQTKGKTNNLLANSAYVVVNYKEPDNFKKEKNNYDLVQLELFDPSTERSLNYLYEVAKPSSSEIALDAEYLVQIVDPLPKLTKA